MLINREILHEWIITKSLKVVFEEFSRKHTNDYVVKLRGWLKHTYSKKVRKKYNNILEVVLLK